MPAMQTSCSQDRLQRSITKDKEKEELIKIKKIAIEASIDKKDAGQLQLELNMDKWTLKMENVFSK